MGPKKSWIDKKKAQKFTLVHRSHQDPLYYDEDSSNAVLVPVSSASDNKSNDKLRSVNKDELKQVENQMKQNEGHAAAYGITFDDSEYDYMQHLKPMGKAADAIFISATTDDDSKNKHKGSKLAQLLDESMLPSSEEKKYDYQQQQDIPDDIKGFKPNLNEDLREALTALEDENYLDKEQDVDEVDVFTELLGGESGGKKQVELSLNEYDQLNEYHYEDEDDEDWDYDDYDDGYVEGEGETGNGFDWEKDFSKFKKSQSKKQNDWDSDDEFEDEKEEGEEEEDTIGDLPDLQNLKSSKSAKKKSKRSKGTKTDTSSYSMSSSAIARTEQMTIIDDKYDVLKEKYERADQEDQEEYQPFDLNNERDDFMDMVDDFLDNYEMENRNRRIVKKNPEMESYKKAALDVTNTKMKYQKPKGLRGVIKDLDELQL